jgi:hypothetical protein
MGEVGGVQELASIFCCEVGSSSDGRPLDLLLRLPQFGILLLEGCRRTWYVEETSFVQAWWGYRYYVCTL